MIYSEKIDILWQRGDSSSATGAGVRVEPGAEPAGPRDDVVWPLEDQASSEDFDPGEEMLSKYSEVIHHASAYRWLLSRIRAITDFDIPGGRDVANDIRSRILGSLDQPKKISRSTPNTTSSVVFDLDWDPTDFANTEYGSMPDSFLSEIITLTGDGNNVQALTCSEYLKQTWPETGNRLLGIIEQAISKHRAKTGHSVKSTPAWSSVSGTLPDETSILVRVLDDPDHKIRVQVSGDAYSIAEVGEQLAWLGAAIRSSPLDHGVVHCDPVFWPMYETASRDDTQGTPVELGWADSTKSIYKLGFRLEPKQSDEADVGEADGNCWQNMFRNPVVARGFPIRRRTQPDSGLDIPLSIMASLAKSRRLVNFSGRTCIKGFSTLLVAVRLVSDTILWHLFFNPDGSYISYSDIRAKDAKALELPNRSALETGRHILGWCTNAKNYCGKFAEPSYNPYLRNTNHGLMMTTSGAKEANYNLEWSGLPKPGPSCAFEKVSIVGGQFITAGVSCVIGLKDRPLHISLGGDDYVSTLLMLARRYFVLYDLGDKRAWFADGASTVLHLLRAAIRHHQKDRLLRHLLLFREADFQEATAPHSGQDAAVEVLVSEHNLNLPLYRKIPAAGATPRPLSTENSPASWANATTSGTHAAAATSFTLRDKVDQIMHMLSQILAHHDDLSSQSGVGFRLRTTPRRCLEGFDFMDLAAGQGTLWPKVSILNAKGQGWVDFVRAVGAVPLFGRGFGELLCPQPGLDGPSNEMSSSGSGGGGGKKPTRQPPSPCPSCSLNTSFPSGSDYLAVPTGVLADILRMRGSTATQPWRVVDNIYWHTPEACFEACGGGGGVVSCKADRVQVLLPAEFPRLWGRRLRSPRHGDDGGGLPLPEAGAVVFGHSRKFPLRWRGAGGTVPVEAEPGAEPAGGTADAEEHEDGWSTDTGADDSGLAASSGSVGVSTLAGDATTTSSTVSSPPSSMSPTELSPREAAGAFAKIKRSSAVAALFRTKSKRGE